MPQFPAIHYLPQVTDSPTGSAIAVNAAMKIAENNPWLKGADILSRTLDKFAKARESDLEAGAVADLLNGKALAEIDPRLLGSDHFLNAYDKKDASDRAWSAEQRAQAEFQERLRQTALGEEARLNLGNLEVLRKEHGDDWIAEYIRRDPTQRRLLASNPNYAEKIGKWLTDNKVNITDVPDLDTSGFSVEDAEKTATNIGENARAAKAAYEALRRQAEDNFAYGRDSKGNGFIKGLEDVIDKYAENSGLKGSTSYGDFHNNVYNNVATLRAHFDELARNDPDKYGNYANLTDAELANAAIRYMDPGILSGVPILGRFSQPSFDVDAAKAYIQKRGPLQQVIARMQGAARNTTLMDNISASIDELKRDLAVLSMREKVLPQNSIQLAALRRQKARIQSQIGEQRKKAKQIIDTGV